MATSQVVYLGQLRCQATHLQSGNQILTDAPVDNHGRGEAFSPTDLVATAFGNCMMTIMGIVAERDGIDMTGSTIDITKVMSAEAPRRIAEVHANLQIKTTAVLSDTDKAKLVRAAHTCPVALSLHSDIKQVITFEWHPS